MSRISVDFGVKYKSIIIRCRKKKSHTHTHIRTSFLFFYSVMLLFIYGNARHVECWSPFIISKLASILWSKIKGKNSTTPKANVIKILNAWNFFFFFFFLLLLLIFLRWVLFMLLLPEITFVKESHLRMDFNLNYWICRTKNEIMRYHWRRRVCQEEYIRDIKINNSNLPY